MKVAAAVPSDTVFAHDDIVFSNDVHQNNKFEWFPYLTYFHPGKAEEIGIARKQKIA
ncbi:MAG: hypothetical protein ACKVP3_29010 [Hyphomicrobiaceae bacterium]